MNLKIKDIVKCTNGILFTGNEDVECENFTRDSRIVKNGDTFIALQYKDIDGNFFWKEALENGADTVIINKFEISDEDKEKYKNKNIIQVDDTKKALAQMAAEKRKLYKDLIVVGVTGSVGKTSTKDIIANVLSQRFKTLKTTGSRNCDIGLALTLLELRDHEAAVIEIGMNKLDKISYLSNITKPTISVITNIGTAHIGNLGSKENILKAKLEILDGMTNPLVVINNDDKILKKWAIKNKENINIRTFGIENKSECMAENITKHENSSNYTCTYNNDKFNIEVPIGGVPFVINSVCAALIGKMLNLSNEEIQKGISSFELTKRRMEIIKLNNGITLIDDSYNASFDSMKAAVEYLSNTTSKRKIAVFGDMFELGDYSEELHRKVGYEVAKNKIDLLFTIGENSIFIAKEAEKNGMPKKKMIHFSNSEILFETIKKIMRKGDIILFKASNGMKLFEMVQRIVHEEK